SLPGFAAGAPVARESSPGLMSIGSHDRIDRASSTRRGVSRWLQLRLTFIDQRARGFEFDISIPRSAAIVRSAQDRLGVWNRELEIVRHFNRDRLARREILGISHRIGPARPRHGLRLNMRMRLGILISALEFLARPGRRLSDERPPGLV